MHFWINKSSQGFVGYGHNRRILCSGGGFYPDPMVTPVHRFQSIESVANNGLRSSRQPYSPRLSYHPVQTYNYPHQNSRSPNVARSMEHISTTGNGAGAPLPQRNLTTPHRSRSQTTCFKCGVWFFFSMFFFFFAGVKAYIHGTQSEDVQQTAHAAATMSNAELPPPPYHIAVMLSPRNNLDLATVQVIRDSPPPSYEKAVT
ncbi:unnamed protein product [Brassicogethes aeneus]|uniref:Uncharacterized protein n=1 Tax=Brassicogethes aeneus TaxID=1431903 RepID=A0A9P0BHT1_BRAAE|nr:unnamed protein product [Brassicogethes aeneus]